ncbi:MAG: LOG family protein [Gammaproteobacteria bacterium]|nr:LOG family protein [Gammaproteobacteria bacterium]
MEPEVRRELELLQSDHGVDAQVRPKGSLEMLSQHEINQLRDTSKSGLYDMVRRCALAVLNSGRRIDDARVLLEKYKDFDIRIVQQDRGIRLDLTQAPSIAFVDGKMIRGIREHLFTVLRDILYIHNEILEGDRYDLNVSDDITNAVFHILRNANVLRARKPPNLAVCWGGHAISSEEYDYTKAVGYEFGLRSIDVCTGCGPGAMKGPMKGATIGHAKQRMNNGRYIGITEPGIIAAESPNPIVNRLVIMPDIEKRLEAFVRLAHGIVVFPGGVGTVEELLYLLGVLLHPDNEKVPVPVVLTGPASSEKYFEQLDGFIGATLGRVAQQRYEVIVDNPSAVARRMRQGFEAVRDRREDHEDAFFFNWSLEIIKEFQSPFVPTHKAMAKLYLGRDQETHLLAANLRRAFSGIVAGNVKDHGIREVEEHGPFEISGDPTIAKPLDELLQTFAEQNRMKLNGKDYQPCYRIMVKE